VNEDNKKANIREEIDRANEAIRASNLLFENGFLRDAVSKVYYSLLYNIRALLLTEGLEPKSHEGPFDFSASILLSLEPLRQETLTYSQSL
jgi:uncharacterized protein (UPF0332 family)